MVIIADETSPWIHLDLSYWEDLIQDQSPRLYRKKTFLFRQGDSPEYVFIVKSGRVRITSYRAEGSEKQFYIAETGSICGEMACVQHLPYAFSAVAIVDSQVFRLPYRLMEGRLRDNWPLAKKVMGVICRKAHIFMEQILELSFSQSIQRVARILLNIAAQYGQALPDGGIRIGIRFTHQDIASMINASRVTTSNVLNDFSGRGIISREGGYYILHDPARLREYLLEDEGL